MKILIDTCVLYPTVMREIVVGVAGAGEFEPLWSPRILEEWARAARKLGPTGEIQARGEIALLRARFPSAEITVQQGAERHLWLPDPDDVHVLAAAVAGNADAIMTVNAKDFPRNILSEQGIQRIDPDGYLLSVWQREPTLVEPAARDVLNAAREMSGNDWDMRALLKKARLPRLAKSLAQVS